MTLRAASSIPTVSADTPQGCIVAHPCTTSVSNQASVLVSPQLAKRLHKAAGSFAVSIKMPPTHVDFVSNIHFQCTTSSLYTTTISMSEANPFFRAVLNDATFYRPLDVRLKEIRYLKLAPGRFEDPLLCFIDHISLEDDVRVPYEALSYTWGDVSQTVEMYLQYLHHGWNSEKLRQKSAQKFSITPNLCSALKRLRHETRQRSVWVDAVCINQMDPLEKSSQIPLMGLVYSRATRVLVWLGETDLFTSIALKALTKYNELEGMDKAVKAGDMRPDMARLIARLREGEKMFQDLEDYEIDFRWRLERFSTISPVILPFMCMADADMRDELCRALSLMDIRWGEMAFEQQTEVINWIIQQCANELVARPWFRRIWVVQEVALAPRDIMHESKVLIHIGNYRVPWTVFCAFQKNMHFYRRNLVSWKQRYVTPNDTSDMDFFNDNWGFMRLRSSHDIATDILALLTLTREFGASVSRDKLFAMMLLADDTRDEMDQNELLRPDFLKPLGSILSDFARWYILSKLTLDIFYLIDPSDAGDGKIEKPSWAPDILSPSDEWPFAKFIEGPRSSPQPEFRIPHLSSENQDPQIRFKFRSTSLLVRGIKLARIIKIVPYRIEWDESVKMLCLDIDGADIALFRLIERTYGATCEKAWHPHFLQSYVNMFGCLQEGDSEYSGIVDYFKNVPPVQEWEAFRSQNDDGQEDDFHRTARKFCKNRRIFVCQDRTFGICPESAHEGDYIAALETGKHPFVLAPASADTYRILGACSFFDAKWQHGEMAEFQQKHDIPIEVFELV